MNMKWLFLLAMILSGMHAISVSLGSVENNSTYDESISGTYSFSNWENATDERVDRAVILTAIPAEYMAVVGHLDNLTTERTVQGTVYQVGDFYSKYRHWKVAVAENGMYNVNSAVAAERSIWVFHPKALFFVGTAGGFQGVQAGGYSGVDVGDVVVASKAYDYGCAIVNETTTRAWPEVYRPTYRLMQIAREVAKEEKWKAFTNSSMTVRDPKAVVAPIASGGMLVASNLSDVYWFLQSDYADAVAVEMEGAGFLAAAYANPGVEALLVRGISDKLNDFENLDAELRVKIASDHASAFAFQVLSEIE